MSVSARNRIFNTFNTAYRPKKNQYAYRVSGNHAEKPTSPKPETGGWGPNNRPGLSGHTWATLSYVKQARFDTSLFDGAVEDACHFVLDTIIDKLGVPLEPRTVSHLLILCSLWRHWSNH